MLYVGFFYCICIWYIRQVMICKCLHISIDAFLQRSKTHLVVASILERASLVKLPSSTSSQGFFSPDFFLVFYTHIHCQGTGSLWNKVNVHVQCRSKRRSDWMDSIQVGKGGGGRLLSNQSDWVLCQTFLQRHGTCLFEMSQLYATFF